MRVAVLGGTVFVGRAIVEVLVAAGHDVTVVHRGEHEPDPASGYPDVAHVHADRAALPRLDCEAVVDCLATTGADTERVLSALPDVPLVMLSSCDVYPMLHALRAGTVECDAPITEATPVRSERFPYRGLIEGMDDYEKLDCEPQYLERGGVVLRLPFVTGPHDYQRRESFVLRHIAAGSPTIALGAGGTAISRVHVADVGTAVHAVLRNDVRGEVFVLGDAPSSDGRAWADEIVAAAGAPLDVVTVADDEVPEDAWWTQRHPQQLLVSPAKAMSMLDWRPTPWREAVRTSVEWHLRHPPATPD